LEFVKESAANDETKTNKKEEKIKEKMKMIE
jgi:hypothetical protein